MDDDIQDILASISAPSISERTRDLQALTRAWVNERTAPELLPYPTSLVERTTDRIKRQIETIEEMTGLMDPKSNFTLVILQTELERFKFIVRSFLRARIAKLDQYPVHYQAQAQSDHDLLSTLEQQYLQSHQVLLHNHYLASFLGTFPQQLHGLDDTSGGVSMIDKPDDDTAVFCRVLRDAGSVEVQTETTSTYVELRRGDLWLLRWLAIKEAVVAGDVELV